ncbi:MAG: hypothetical protein Q4F84_10655 [Fibrobacter sp.]|nr:hypothetical protein [Fibrobacter sp.]
MKFYVTLHRERNLINKINTGLKDCVEMDEADVVELFQNHSYTKEQAEHFLQGVKNSPFNDWQEWR